MIFKKIIVILIVVIMFLAGFNVFLINQQRNEDIDKAIWWIRGIDMDVESSYRIDVAFVGFYEVQKIEYKLNIKDENWVMLMSEALNTLNHYYTSSNVKNNYDSIISRWIDQIQQLCIEEINRLDEQRIF